MIFFPAKCLSPGPKIPAGQNTEKYSNTDRCSTNELVRSDGFPSPALWNPPIRIWGKPMWQSATCGSIAILQATLFHPDIPNGVTIHDVTSTGKGAVSVKGGNRATDRRILELTKGATPGGGQNVLFWSTVVLLCAIVLCFAYRRYKKRYEG